MRVLFERGNKTRVKTINITTLPCSYAHCAPSRFSLNEHENLGLIIINRPDTAILYSWTIIDNDFNEFRCMQKCYSCDRTTEH